MILRRDDYLYRRSVKDRFVMDMLDMEMTEVYDPEGIIKTNGRWSISGVLWFENAL